MDSEIILYGEKISVCPLNQIWKMIYQYIKKLLPFQKHMRYWRIFGKCHGNALKKEFVRCVIWKVFSANKASCRIAEKLGGNVLERKNLMEEAVCAADWKVNPEDYKKAPAIVTYEIRRK